MTMSGKQRRRAAAAAQSALILAAMVVMMAPIAWIFMAAFKRHVDVYQLKLLFTPTLENFAVVFGAPYNLGDKIRNSAAVAAGATAAAIPLATAAAYAFSRFRMRGEKSVFVVILATQFVPAAAVVLPFFVMFRDLGILDTRIGLMIVHLSLVLPFAVWMIKGAMDALPPDSEEAALVDGAGRLRVIRDIVIPTAAPGIAAAAIFCFIISWNDFLFALILTTNDATTLPVGLALFKAEEGDLWNLLSAAGIIIMAPMFVLALAVQRHFVQGMTMGAAR